MPPGSEPSARARPGPSCRPGRIAPVVQRRDDGGQGARRATQHFGESDPTWSSSDQRLLRVPPVPTAHCTLPSLMRTTPVGHARSPVVVTDQEQGGAGGRGGLGPAGRLHAVSGGPVGGPRTVHRPAALTARGRSRPQLRRFAPHRPKRVSGARAEKGGQGRAGPAPQTGELTGRSLAWTARPQFGERRCRAPRSPAAAPEPRSARHSRCCARAAALATQRWPRPPGLRPRPRCGPNDRRRAPDRRSGAARRAAPAAASSCPNRWGPARQRAHPARPAGSSPRTAAGVFASPR